MNSCLTASMDRILHKSEDCSFLCCINAAGNFIHSGILWCPAGHPLLHRAIHKLLEKSLSSPAIRLSAYTTVVQHLWDMLSSQAIDPLTSGKNATRDCGFVWIMTEQKESENTFIHGRSHGIDEYVATPQGADASHDENGCQLSKRDSQRGRHLLYVYDRSVSPASLAANNAGIEVRCPHHYRL